MPFGTSQAVFHHCDLPSLSSAMLVRIRLKKSNRSCSPEKSVTSPDAICSTRPARSFGVLRNCTTNAVCAEKGAPDGSVLTAPGLLDSIPPCFRLFFLSIGGNDIGMAVVEIRFRRLVCVEFALSLRW